MDDGSQTPNENDLPQPPPPRPPAPEAGALPGAPDATPLTPVTPVVPVTPVTPPARRRVLTVALVALAAVAVAGGIAAGAAMLLLRGSSDQLAAKVPADVDVFATAYLDPAAGQKMNLFRMLDRFPALRSDAQAEAAVDEALDTVLAPAGLSHSDVRPWLGSQIAVTARLNVFAGQPEAAVLVDAADEAAAQAALETLKSSGDWTWSEDSYGGVTVSIGRNGFGGDGIAAAFVESTMVVANTPRLVHDVIDVSSGDADSLADSATYVEAVGQLPSGKLGLAFINTGPLFQTLAGLGAGQAAGGGLTGADPAALRAVAMSVSAEPHGLQLDAATLYDLSKLPPSQRDALADPRGIEDSLTWVPADAYAMAAIGSLDAQLDALLSNPLVAEAPALARLGLTGPDGAVQHLTGEAALTVGPGQEQIPTGAFVVGTADEASMRRFLDRLSVVVAEGISSAGPGGPFGGSDSASAEIPAGYPEGVPSPVPLPSLDGSSLAEAKQMMELHWERTTYEGVAISVLRIPELAQYGVEPAYVVADGAGIIAASPKAIRDVLDARAGEDITSSQVFADAQRALGGIDQSLFFLDVAKVSGAVREALPPGDRRGFDLLFAPNLEPVKALISGARNDGDRSISRAVVLIP